MKYKAEFLVKQIIAAREEESEQYQKLLYIKVCEKLLLIIGKSLEIFAFFFFYFSSQSVFNVNEVFKCLGFIDKMQEPISTFSTYLLGYLNALVSSKRVADFLNQPEMNKTAKTDTSVIEFKNCYFNYEEEKKDNLENSSLRNICLKIQSGQKVAITGKTGAGKSSLLKALSQSLFLSSGEYSTFDSISIANERPWLFDGTIRENIVLDKPFEREFYLQVLDTCCLNEDLIKMANSDLTCVIQNGSNFSTGQRARIVIARCLYNRSDLLLIDDLFTNIDSNSRQIMAKQMFGECFKNTTIVFVASCSEMLDKADLIIKMEEGSIVSLGTFDEVKGKLDKESKGEVTESEEIKQEKFILKKGKT